MRPSSFLLSDSHSDSEEESSIYSMISPTLQCRILQKTSMVWVLTLSFRLSRVICAGLTWYFLISAYCVIPRCCMVFHRPSKEIKTSKPHFCLNVNRKGSILLLPDIGYYRTDQKEERI